MKHIQNYHTKTTCKASLADRLAALETRTFARTETHIPTYPAIPEHKAPRRKAATVMNAVVDLEVANYESWLAKRCDSILKKYKGKLHNTSNFNIYLHTTFVHKIHTFF